MKKKRIKIAVLAAVVIGVISAAAFLNATYNNRSNKTAAVINGEKIKLSDVDKRTSYVISELKKQYGEDFEKEINNRIKSTEGEEKKKHEENKKLLIDSRKDVLESMVDTRVLYLKGTADNLSAEEDLKEIKELLDQFKEGTIKTYMDEGLTKKEAEKKYEDNKDALQKEFYGTSGMTSDDYISYFMEYSVAGKMEGKIYDSINVTDDEIKQYYNDNIDEYVKKAGYDVQELFFPIIDGNKDAASIAAQDTFFAMAQGNPNKSTDFDTTFNEAQNKTHKLSSEGKIIAQTNTVTFENSNRPKLYMDFLKDMSTGQFCSPIPTDKGYYIVFLLTKRQNDDIKTLEDEKENIRDTLRSKKKKAVLDEKIKEYKNEFKVKIYEDILSF